MFDLQSCKITGREKRGDVTQSLTAPSEYNLLVEKESK